MHGQQNIKTYLSQNLLHIYNTHDILL